MNAKRILSAVLAIVMVFSLVVPASAQEKPELTPIYTYESGDYFFEKVSHVDTPLGQADGIVDYHRRAARGAGQGH